MDSATVRPFPVPAAFGVAGEADGATIRAAGRLIASAWGVISADEALAGLTALSVSALSADPSTLALCVPRACRGYPAFARANRFAVSVLGGDQREIAEHCAAEAGGAFDGCWLPFGDGPACLADCAAALACEGETIVERPADAVVIGCVLRAAIGRGSGALVRWRGAYDQLG